MYTYLNTRAEMQEIKSHMPMWVQCIYSIIGCQDTIQPALQILFDAAKLWHNLLLEWHKHLFHHIPNLILHLLSHVPSHWHTDWCVATHAARHARHTWSRCIKRGPFHQMKAGCHTSTGIHLADFHGTPCISWTVRKPSFVPFLSLSVNSRDFWSGQKPSPYL